MIDWDHLQDRGRQVQRNSHWGGPHEIIKTCVNAFHLDLWADQDRRIRSLGGKGCPLRRDRFGSSTMGRALFCQQGILEYLGGLGCRA